MIGLEPITCWLQISCSANWATSAYYIAQLICNQPALPTIVSLHSTIVMNWATLAYTISARIIVQMIFIRNQSVPFNTYYIVPLTVRQLKNITRVTPTGIEPVLPPWKGDVLTAWPRSLILFLSLIRKNSPSRARTYNNSVNSRVLYHWAIEDYAKGFVYTFKTDTEPFPSSFPS